MSQDVSELVRGTKIRDLLFSGAVDACKQMQDVWPVLGEEERDRMTNLIDAWAVSVESQIATRCSALLDRFIASGQPAVAAAEKGISIEGSGVTIKLAAVRAQVPQAFFTHKGSFLIVLNNCEALSLEELNKQGDFFETDTGPSPAAGLAGDTTPAASSKASPRPTGKPARGRRRKASQDAHAEEATTELEEPQPPEDPCELFRDDFLISLGQLTAAEFAQQYDAGGEFEGIAATYWQAGTWTPTEAAVNESLDPTVRRLIADGPAPGAQDGEVAA